MGNLNGRKAAIRLLQASGRFSPLIDPDTLDADTLSGHLLAIYKENLSHEIFESFYRLNKDRVRSLVSHSKYGYAWNHDPMEIITDIFFDIFRFAKRYAFQGGPSFARWIKVLTRNRMKKALKSYYSRPGALAAYQDQVHDKGANDPGLIFIRGEEAASLALGGCFLISVCLAGIMKLSSQEQTALRLHELGGYTYKALSEELRLSYSETANLVRRARRKTVRFLKCTLGSGGFRTGRLGDGLGHLTPAEQGAETHPIKTDHKQG